MKSTDNRVKAVKAALHRDLLAWYEACRRDLPWRRTQDPWAIWVSEIMLQQTRVETVVPYFDRFMTRFPTPLALAEAAEDEVLAAWSGLGYYRRARMLHAGAKSIAETRGAMPADREGLLTLAGVGRYTAGAIASIAYGEAVGLVDGNVARVLARVLGIEEDMRSGAGMREAERVSEELVNEAAPGAWNQSLMELGATICTPRNPSCEKCPIASSCIAYKTNRTSELPRMSEKAKPKAQSMQALVATRVTDGFILLARRKSEGLFGGLWEPPLVDGKGKEGRAALSKHFPNASLESKKAGVVTHVLSHRKLTIDVHRATITTASAELVERENLPEIYEAADFIDPTKLRARETTLGISTLAQKILATAATAT